MFDNQYKINTALCGVSPSGNGVYMSISMRRPIESYSN